MIYEFGVQLDLADSLEKLKELCQKFLHAIASQEGAAETIANMLRDRWDPVIKLK